MVPDYPPEEWSRNPRPPRRSGPPAGPPQGLPGSPTPGLVVLALLALGGLWFLRPLPLIHGPALFFWRYPLTWLLPLAAAALVLGFFRLRSGSWGGRGSSVELSRATSLGDLISGSKLGPSLLALAAAGAVFVFSIPLARMLEERAIHRHYGVEVIAELPAGGSVRVMPKEVAVELAENGFNSPTEQLAEGHMVRTPQGALTWTFGQQPDGLFRILFKKTAGTATLDAGRTDRSLNFQEAEFQSAPGQLVTDNVNWDAYKKNFLTSVAETVYILDQAGEPLLLAPYLSYEGFPVRIPVLGGVLVVHPDGEIEDLSPDEARERPEIVASGRLFPETLARRIQDSYRYVDGIANRFFTHRNILEVADTESNRQPYLMDFGDAGTKWVSTAKPYGRAFATGGIFLTDTVSGDTQLWRVPRERTLTGNARALEIVRSLSIPGIVFADEGAGDAGGKFRAIEPRPVFVNGKLMFLVSIIPNSGNTVTKSVIVDAASNKAIAIFDHDSDEDADAKLLAFIRAGRLGADDRVSTGGGDTGAEEPADTGGDPSADDSIKAAIEELLEQNREQAEALQRLQEQLQDSGGG